MKANVGDCEIAYDRQGEGEPVLLVMGLGTPRIGWFHQFYALSQSYDVTCYDNRGVGETVFPEGSWTMQDMAKDAVGVADAVGYDTFHLVGISMGGMISQEVALGWPERLRSLTLMATTPAGPESVPMSPEYAQVLTLTDPQERARRAVELLFGEEFRRHNPEIIDALVQMSAVGGLLPGADSDSPAGGAMGAGFMGQLTAVGAWFFAGGAFERLSQISVPTLVLHGGEDHLIPVDNGKILARDIPGARLRIWENAGHALNAEYPDEVNAEVVAHLEAATAGASR